MSEQGELSELELKDNQREDIRLLMDLIDKGDFGERDIDLELVEAVTNYLEGEIDFEGQTLSVLPYSDDEVENRDVVYDDDFLVVTLDDVDPDEGNTYGVWVRKE